MPYFLTAPRGDAYENLARDELVLNELAPGEIALYLYVNDRAVIVGRNQNPYIECDMDKLNADGVQLVRRISGGGAVWHDSGNLNYSFIASDDVYDEKRQLRVVLSALSRFGITAEISGRNDLCVNGLKVSGTAVCKRGNNRLQHGTLLIAAELGALPKYLTPSKMKLEAKGIKSVRARVCNLNELSAEITVEGMKTALKEAFEREYGKAEAYPMDGAFASRLEKLTRERMSRDWRMGESPRYDVEFETRLSIGSVRLCLNVAGGRIAMCSVYSDCMDDSLPKAVSDVLTGAAFDVKSMTEALKPLKGAAEIADWVAGLSI